MSTEDLAIVGMMSIIFSIFMAMSFLFGIGFIILSVIRDKANDWIGKKLSEVDSRHDEDDE